MTSRIFVKILSNHKIINLKLRIGYINPSGVSIRVKIYGSSLGKLRSSLRRYHSDSEFDTNLSQQRPTSDPINLPPEQWPMSDPANIPPQ